MSEFSFKRRLRSFKDAGSGLVTMLKSQHNAWIHAGAAALAVGAGVALRIDASDWRWLVMAITLVWLAEAMNTAFEYLCDVVSPEYNKAVKHAKDIAAGAVLVCAIGAATLGLMIFLPHV